MLGDDRLKIFCLFEILNNLLGQDSMKGRRMVLLSKPIGKIVCVFSHTGLLVLWLVPALVTGCNVAAKGYNAEGRRLFEQGNPQAAIDRFHKALASDPLNADSRYNLGAVYHRLAKVENNKTYWSQAENYYHQALDADPNHLETHRGMAVLLREQNRSEEAFAHLDNWALRHAGSPEPRVELARLYEEFGDKASAQKHLIEALEMNPHHARALAALGKIREDSGDFVLAYRNYQRSLQQNPYQPHLSVRVAALQPRVLPATAPVPPGGTRIVTQPLAPLR